MKLLETSNSYVINEREYFYNLDRPPVAPSSIKANVPKLMAKIPIGEPKVNRESISRNIFCNDDSCKPKPSQIVSTQNYITLTRYSNQNPTFTTSSDLILNKMYKQRKHIVEITCNDIRQMHFIDNL